MNWTRLRNSLVNQYHEKPQVVASIDLGLRQVREGLELLARLGHLFYLAPGSVSESNLLALEFPRLVYHLDSAPRGYLVRCQSDLELLGEGWFDTLDEAKHADGMGEQFKRGGVFPKSGLPAIAQDDSSSLSPLDQLRAFGLIDSKGNLNEHG